MNFKTDQKLIHQRLIYEVIGGSASRYMVNAIMKTKVKCDRPTKDQSFSTLKANFERFCMESETIMTRVEKRSY